MQHIIRGTTALHTICKVDTSILCAILNASWPALDCIYMVMCVQTVFLNIVTLFNRAV